MPLMKLSLTKEEYVACLHQLYEIVAAWEENACAQAPEWIQKLLSTRGRKHLLERDLNWLGVKEISNKRPILPVMTDDASFLGTMYVIEGSTLGGQLIARHVEQVLELEAGKGDSFFRGYGQQTGTMWKEFCEVLRVKVPDHSAEVVIHSARNMFEVFRSWMQDTCIDLP